MAKYESSKPQNINLTVEIVSRRFVIGTLSFNSNKNEFSYHLAYPFNSSDRQLNHDNGKVTSRVDHVTWHRNVIHIKCKDNTKLDLSPLSGGLLSQDRKEMLPCYVESHYFQKDKPDHLLEINDFKPWKGSEMQQIFDLDTSDGFTMVLLLVPEDMDSNLVLMHYSSDNSFDFENGTFLSDLCVRRSAGRIQLGNGLDIFILCTPLKCRTRFPSHAIFSEDGCRIMNYKNPLSGVIDLLKQVKN